MSKRLERRCRWLLLGGLRTRARQASGLFHAAEYLGEGGASTSALVYLAVVALLTGSLAAVALGVRRTQLTRR
jgi:hypothetical protein